MQTSWDIRLKEQRERNFKNYLPLTLDLSIARTNQEFPIPGDCLQVIGVSSLSAVATVRFNRNTNEAIDLKQFTKIKPDVFTSFYITNTAQAGETMDIIVGINFEIENILNQGETQPAIIITNALADTDTQGEANVCNEVLIQADLANTGKVWLNFGAAAVENQCHVLDPGDVRRASVSNTNRIHALFKTANDLLFVFYEV